MLGHVQTSNGDWTTFWSSAVDQTKAPNATELKVGMHIGEDPNKARVQETIGYIVFESGEYNIGGYDLKATLGSKSVTGDQTAYTDTFDGHLVTATMSGVAGGDGGFATLDAADNLTGLFLLEIEEDILGDTERNHTTESVAYVQLK